ncbi:MAG TPA: FxsA family protein [Pirellulaceae bacterium]|nr:FxsA family protein [Pirellulaceae bacterium]HMO90899.1 FxsA family protein [Pirellulaceae bacterium]HMP68625.1 FxsA family protein [Pirellulaceae bacterium]
MFKKLVALFIIVPLVDLFILLAIARIHWLLSVCAILVSALVGVWLVRRQGLAVYNRLRSDVASGHLPADSLFDGGLVLFAAALLLTPGLVTDIAGYSLLIPASRKWFLRRLKSWIAKRVQFSTASFTSTSFENTIDAEFTRTQPQETHDANCDPRVEESRN